MTYILSNSNIFNPFRWYVMNWLLIKTESFRGRLNTSHMHIAQFVKIPQKPLQL